MNKAQKNARKSVVNFSPDLCDRSYLRMPSARDSVSSQGRKYSVSSQGRRYSSVLEDTYEQANYQRKKSVKIPVTFQFPERRQSMFPSYGKRRNTEFFRKEDFSKFNANRRQTMFETGSSLFNPNNKRLSIMSSSSNRRDSYYDLDDSEAGWDWNNWNEEINSTLAKKVVIL